MGQDWLKAFRDEVTKPKMTGGEKMYASCRSIMGWYVEWGGVHPSIKTRCREQAALLGIKDDE